MEYVKYVLYTANLHYVMINASKRHSQWWRVVVIYRLMVTVAIHCSSKKLSKSMYQMIKSAWERITMGLFTAD